MTDPSVKESGTVRVPRDISDLERVFSNHYNYYSEIRGEVAHQQETGEGEIQREYSGRVVFELLQNAIDRAENQVYVGVAKTDHDGYEYALVAANDGLPVRVDPDYDYENPPDVGGTSDLRSDFNAICSLHTSNKSPDETIGTKGIGFSSVFYLDSYVRVWSQLEDGSSWWGMEMHSPFTGDLWEHRRGDSTVQRGLNCTLDEDIVESFEAETPRPSYHFPLPLVSKEPSSPILDLHWASTIVEVPIPNGETDIVTDQIDQLERHHLHFTGLSPGTQPLNVHFERPNDEPFYRRTWPESDSEWRLSFWQSDENAKLSNLAADAELGVETPGAAVAWPPSATQGDISVRNSSIYGYLPTLMQGPFGVDIQADFQLTIDRTNLRLDDDAMGPYNRRLLHVCAELHVLEALQRAGLSTEVIEWSIIKPAEVEHKPVVGDSEPSVNFWRHVDPTKGGSPGASVVIDHAETLLFSEGGTQESERFSNWAALAAEFFRTREEWPLRTYREFWEASLGWIDRICTYKTRGENWRKVALALCDALREEAAPVAPIVLDADADPTTPIEAVPLPPRRENVGRGGHLERSERELFLRSPNLPQAPLPSILRKRNRVVTTFDFPADLKGTNPNPLGTRDFNRWELLSEVRQLPNSLTGWTYEPISDENPDKAAECQRELIEFAVELYQLDTGSNQQSPAEDSGFTVGWRVSNDISENQFRAGKALATLFLPTDGDKWQPARELHVDEVDRVRLGDLPDDLDLEQFLEFLGVSRSPPNDGACLRLIEGGPDGIVGKVDMPPIPTEAGRGSVDVSFEPTPGAGKVDEYGWRKSLRQAWDDWLADLLQLEKQSRFEDEDDTPVRTDFFAALRDREWYPVGDDAADPPVDAGADSKGIAPGRLALVSGKQTQLPRVIWSLNRKINETDTAILKEVGAVPGLDPETLRDNNAQAAFRLLTQLQERKIERICEDPRDLQALERMFDRILRAIVRSDELGRVEDLSVLITTGDQDDTTLRWASDLEDVWIPESAQDREIVCEHFPSEHCVVASVPKRQLSDYPPLAEKSINVDRIVRAMPSEGKASDEAKELQSRIKEAIPELLALVEATTQIEIDTGFVMDRWHPKVTRECDNVYEEIHVSFGENPPRSVERMKETGGEVVVQSGDQPRMFFDHDDENQPPPIPDFGEALATVLLGDKGGQVESLFARALTARFDEESNLQRLVDRKGANSYVERFRVEFSPLDEAERSRLLDATAAALSELNIQLNVHSPASIRDLSPADLDLRNASDGVTEQEVKGVLTDIDLPTTREWDWFRPRFTCYKTHKRRWEDWLDKHSEQLIPYLEELLVDQGIEDATASSIRNDLDKYTRKEQCPQVEFNPAVAVKKWLQQFESLTEIPAAEEILNEARRREKRFDEVGTIVKGDEEFTPQPLDQPTPLEKETGRISRTDAIQETQAKMRVGEDAEEAVINQVVAETIESIEQAVEAGTVANREAGLKRLRWALPDDGVTVERVDEACAAYMSDRDSANLADGLHVSQAWDGAGFDIIGLQYKDGELVPVRTEVKAISDDPPVSVHLSTNQLSVYEKVELEDSSPIRYRGQWRLVGVKPSGTAHDLTAFLEDLPESALHKLWERGFDHDGLMLTIEKAEPA